MNRSELQNEVERRRRELEQSLRKMEAADRQCGHEWGPTVDASVYHPGYTFPGDAPGTMGVDRRGPVHIPSRTEKRWKRVCNKCGKEEFTTRAKENQVVTAMPVW